MEKDNVEEGKNSKPVFQLSILHPPLIVSLFVVMKILYFPLIDTLNHKRKAPHTRFPLDCPYLLVLKFSQHRFTRPATSFSPPLREHQGLLLDDPRNRNNHRHTTPQKK